MNLEHKITLVKLAFDGYFLQRDEVKRKSADAIFALTDEIEKYIEDHIPEANRIWCLSITAEIKDLADRWFKDPSGSEKTSDLEVLLAKLRRV